VAATLGTGAETSEEGSLGSGRIGTVGVLGFTPLALAVEDPNPDVLMKGMWSGEIADVALVTVPVAATHCRWPANGRSLRRCGVWSTVWGALSATTHPVSARS